MRFSKRQSGFTILELLTVIAIIGVLAALIFPVASGARKKAKETQCINNMYQVFTAIKQFQLDEHRYPDFIAGPVEFLGSDPVPLDKTGGVMNGQAVSLFPEYIESVKGLQCPLSSLNAENKEYSMVDIVADPMYALLDGGTTPNKNGLRASTQFYLYKMSSYDFQWPRGTSSGQVHYSTVRLNMNQPNAMNDPDVERQLRYRVPPSDTVITWCSYHRGDPNDTSNKDLVLFLDGRVERKSSSLMEPWATSGWRVKPGN